MSRSDRQSLVADVLDRFQIVGKAGTTIIQVTHSEANAAYGSRTIQLKDGWVVGANGS